MKYFDLYVGIDWSGAKGKNHSGISVFVLDNKNRFPVKVHPKNKYWSRIEIAEWILKVSKHYKIFVGIDFAFSYHYDHKDFYFKNSLDSPKTPYQLWNVINKINADEDDFYGGKIWDHYNYGKYYNAPNRKIGKFYKSTRRYTEENIKKIKAPSPAFNCVGPGAVGTGSLAGMRMLLYLKKSANIWPFYKFDLKKKITLVETFPSYYFMITGVNPIKKQHVETKKLNFALEYYGTKKLPQDFKVYGPDSDDADALISSVALKKFSKNDEYFLTPTIAKYEGWIFGSKINNI